MVMGGAMRFALAGLLMIALAPAAAGAEIVMRTDRPVAALSESFQIVFEARGSVDADPDFSPLEQDFQVITTSQSSRLSIVNGNTSSTKTWTLTVLARRTGRLEIPAIAFGADRSNTGHVDVTMAATPPRAGADAQTNEVYLEVEAQPLDPYVQQQILYKVRLFRAFPTANASLSEPALEQGDAVIERIGEDVAYDTHVNGRPYQVVERRYAVYAQASGTLKIGPLTFRGQTGASPFSLFDPFGRRPETLVRQSAPVELVVRPKADAAGTGPWLPARDLELTSAWSSDPPEFRVGVPVTRTVSIIAAGLTSSQLPELPGWVPAAFKSYPDQPELSDAHSGDGVTGTRVEKIAIIPSRPGSHELPPIRVTWWNTQTDRLEVAELPAQQIEVLPAEGGAGVPPPEPVLQGGPVAAPAASGAPDRTWQWISLALALSWLATVAAWWWSRRRRVTPAPAIRPAAALREVERACTRNDAAAAKDALLAWAATRWPEAPARSLGDIARRGDADLAAQVRELDAFLYGRAAGAWSGAGLWRALRAAADRDPGMATEPGSALEPLHRIGR